MVVMLIVVVAMLCLLIEKITRFLKLEVKTLNSNSLKHACTVAAVSTPVVAVTNHLRLHTMSKVRKEDVIHAIQEFRETPPSTWTLTELKMRLDQLRAEHGITKQNKGKIRPTTVGHSAQRGLQEEGQSPGVLQEVGPSSDPQRDDRPVAEASHGQDLRCEPTRSCRSSGFRKSGLTDLRGSEAGCELLQVGGADLGRGVNLSSTGPSCPLAQRGPNSSQTGGGCFDEEPRAQVDGSESGHFGQEGGGCTQHHQPCEQPGLVGGHGDSDGYHEGHQRGTVRSPSAAATQEGGVGWQLHRDDNPVNANEVSEGLESVPSHRTQGSRSTLPEKVARQIELQSLAVLPETFQDLAYQGRTVLLEVACSPESVLTRVTRERAGYQEAAIRCSHWNNHDLRTGEGVKLILSLIDRLRPQHVWISTECGPYSPIQNLNQRTEEQRQELEAKRRDVLRQYVGASCVMHYAIQKGCHTSWEWSEKSHAWRLPLVQKLIDQYQLWVVVTHGCQVNLRDPKSNGLLHKGWKVMTTHKRLATMLDLPCRCPKGTQHVKCEGSLTGRSAYYTQEFAKRVVAAILQEMTHAMVVQEMSGESQLPPGFGSGSMCMCDRLRAHGREQVCGACLEGDHQKLCGSAVWDPPPKSFGEHAMMQDSGGSEPKDKNHVEHVKKQLYRLHAATGHGSTRHMVEALQKRGAPKHVVQLAKEFSCPICQEKHKVTHKHASSLEPLPPKWSSVEADGGHWIHPVTGEHVEFALIIDQGSRFRVARIMCRGKHKTMNASMFLSYFQEGWCQYFGVPQTLRLDPAGAFRSNEVENHCNKQGIYLDFIPGEAHWKLGACEQAIQGTKDLLTKLVQEDPSLKPEAALALAVQTFNTRELVRGFSPIQHALGRAPDEQGRCLQTLTGQAVEQLLPNAGPEFEENIQRMKVAEQAHAEWSAQQRIVRALNSRGNKRFDYHPGDLVYYWRKQVSGKTTGNLRQKQGCFLGPARILVTETKREPDGQLMPGSSIWVIRGRRLLKCCPEQLRHATQREHLLEYLTEEDNKRAPWTFQRLTAGLGGNEYEDVSQDIPPEAVDEQDQSMEPSNPAEPVEPETPRVRVRGKRQDPAERVPQGSAASRMRTSSSLTGFVQKEAWYDKVSDFSKLEATGEVFWSDEQTAVEVEIDMPSSKREWTKFTTDLEGYFVGALKRRAVEVNERKLSDVEYKAFQEAKAVEVKNFIAARAFEALPSHMRPPEEKAIKMRWLLTWKIREDGTSKPKARAILLGYQDPEYETRETTSPVMTRQSRQLLFAAAGRFKWLVRKGDVTGAFLQGREYPKELYCIPCDEILQEMGLPPGSITRVKRGCYGLVDAPLEWYRSVSTFLDELGFIKSWADPCTWLWKPKGILKGMISGHVDDFLFAGPQKDKEWDSLVAKIQEKFKWTDWEKDTFVQCGVRVEAQSDGSFQLSQSQYVEKVPEVFISASRKKMPNEATTEKEKSALRATLGALSWHAQQVAPHISAEVGLYLSEVSRSTVETINKVNQLVHFTKARKEHKMIIHAIPEHVPVGFFTWADAAGQNRWDGSSTQGIMVGLAPLSMFDGEVAKVVPVAWHASKIDRACRSPGAAEAQAAVSGEDLMFHARFQWGEMVQNIVDIFDVDSVVREIPGCLVSDSRNVFDKLQVSELSIKGAERKTDLSLLCVKHSQHVTNLQLRWVHSEAQLGNSLTKGRTKELEMFYQLGHRWRIVSDESMMSWRRRRQHGLEALQQQQPQASHDGNDSSNLKI